MRDQLDMDMEVQAPAADNGKFLAPGVFRPIVLQVESLAFRYFSEHRASALRLPGGVSKAISLISCMAFSEACMAAVACAAFRSVETAMRPFLLRYRVS